MPNYTSTHTGIQIEQAISNSLSIAESTSDVTVDGVTYNVVWKVAPTASNDVYGLATHPTNGQLYRIHAVNLVYYAELYAPGGLDADVDANGKLILSRNNI